jgi:hypothetical protein
VLKTTFLTGWWPIPGMKIGAIKGSSKLGEAKTNVVLRLRLLLGCLRLRGIRGMLRLSVNDCEYG